MALIVRLIVDFGGPSDPKIPIFSFRMKFLIHQPPLLVYMCPEPHLFHLHSFKMYTIIIALTCFLDMLSTGALHVSCKTSDLGPGIIPNTDLTVKKNN